MTRLRSIVAALLAASTLAPAAPLRVQLAARSFQPGELVVVTIAGARSDAAAISVKAFGRQVTPYVGDDGVWRALVGIDLDAKPGTYSIAVGAGDEQVTRELRVRPKAFPTRRLKVDPDFVTPPPSALEQIERDAKLLEATWRSSAAQRLWSSPFVAPVDEPANSSFGTRSIFNGQPRNAHGGADFPSAAGTPIHAPNAGKVLVARDLYYAGNTVIIDHGLGVFSMLAHLSAFDVHEGDFVKRSDVVGRVGATGRVTGPHLHWALRVNGSRVDPLSALALLGTP
jgi:murein DD-endopeptidase MepM/ murein hydrolase activator NlpD